VANTDIEPMAAIIISAPFIEFMLSVILETLESNDAELDVESPQVTPQVKRLLSVLEERGEAMARDELQRILELKDRTSFRERYLKSALQAGLIELTITDKPNSRLQKY
jgi:hypothetical protein